MIVVLIDWYIKPDKVNDFLKHWKTKLRVKDKDRIGLIGEFLSEPANIKDKPWITWNMRADFPADSRLRCRRFVNIGMWKDEASFRKAIGGSFGKKNAPPEKFEYVRRRRTVLRPKARRIGGGKLPKGDSKGVL